MLQQSISKWRLQTELRNLPYKFLSKNCITSATKEKEESREGSVSMFQGSTIYPNCLILNEGTGVISNNKKIKLHSW